MGTIKIGSVSELKGITISPSVVLFNGNNVQELKHGETVIWTNSKPLIPVMTSNTSPYGVASASSANSSYPAYKAFDNNDSTYWLHANAGSISNQWIMYKFESPVQASKFDIKWVKPYVASVSYKIQGSNDNSEWHDLTDNITTINDVENETLNNNTAYLYYRLYINSQTSSPSSANCGELSTFQLYGKQLKGLIPNMTSNTTPSGVVSASSVQGSNYEAYKAVTGNNTTFWGSSYGDGVGGWWEYDFQREIVPKAFRFNPLTYNKNSTITFKVQLYDENLGSWVDACSEQTISTSNAVTYAGEYSCNAFVMLTNTFKTTRVRYYQTSTTYYGGGNTENAIANLGAVQIYS